jgi:hypothetical protein
MPSSQISFFTVKPITHGMNPDLEEVEDAANPRRQR